MKIAPRRAKTEPTDSSMPPVMMTNPSPMENRPKSPMRLAVLAMLMGERKRGFRIAVTVPTTKIRTRSPRSFFSIASPIPGRRVSVQRMADGKLEHIVFAELPAIKEAADGALMHHGDAVADP